MNGSRIIVIGMMKVIAILKYPTAVRESSAGQVKLDVIPEEQVDRSVQVGIDRKRYQVPLVGQVAQRNPPPTLPQLITSVPRRATMRYDKAKYVFPGYIGQQDQAGPGWTSAPALPQRKRHVGPADQHERDDGLDQVRQGHVVGSDGLPARPRWRSRRPGC